MLSNDRIQAALGTCQSEFYTEVLCELIDRRSDCEMMKQAIRITIEGGQIALGDVLLNLKCKE